MIGKGNYHIEAWGVFDRKLYLLRRYCSTDSPRSFITNHGQDTVIFSQLQNSVDELDLEDGVIKTKELEIKNKVIQILRIPKKNAIISIIHDPGMILFLKPQ